MLLDFLTKELRSRGRCESKKVWV